MKFCDEKSRFLPFVREAEGLEGLYKNDRKRKNLFGNAEQCFSLFAPFQNDWRGCVRFKFSYFLTRWTFQKFEPSSAPCPKIKRKILRKRITIMMESWTRRKLRNLMSDANQY
jgi:hypothetical protein